MPPSSFVDENRATTAAQIHYTHRVSPESGSTAGDKTLFHGEKR